MCFLFEEVIFRFHVKFRGGMFLELLIWSWKDRFHHVGNGLTRTILVRVQKVTTWSPLNTGVVWWYVGTRWAPTGHKWSYGAPLSRVESPVTHL